ncbi:MAG: OmpA family protein [Akkermansiaceae bacterium]
MNKIFTFLILFFVSLSSPVFAEEKPGDLEKIRKDRERLIDLVISLQKNFGNTLKDYAKLQNDYAALRKKKEAPDHSAKVMELQKKLKDALTRLKQQNPDKKTTREQALLAQDIVNLRNELHRDRQELLIARAQVLRLKQLEKQTAELNKQLAGEKKSHAKTGNDLKELKAEQQDLMDKLQLNMTELEETEKARRALVLRLEAVGKENIALKKKVRAQDARIAELSKIEAEHKKTLAAFAELKVENTRLTAMVAEREKQLTNLREHLAAEVKRTLDIPVLIRAREDLEKKLKAKEKESTALAEKNKALTTRKEELENEIAKVEKNIAGMKAQLKKNKATMTSVNELSEQNTRLKADKTKLEKTIDMAKAELVKAMGARNRLEAQLAESRKVAAAAAQLKEMNDALMEEQDLLNNRLQNTEATLKASHQLTDELQASMLTLVKEKADLTKVIKANEAEIEKLRATTAKPSMAESINRLEKEKQDLSNRLAKREEDLKKTRAELGRLQITASVARKQLVSLKRTTSQIEPVRYNLGRSKVAAQQSRVLNQVQEVLKNFPNARFEIVGHTCNIGKAERNLTLSQDRAKSLQEFLISKGVPARILSHRGVGLTEPMVPNDSEANRRLNRRVEVEILD